MMATELVESLAARPQRLLLDNVSWHTYETFLREFDERPLRITYDDGSLEIMTLSLGHEHYGCFLSRMIGILTLELALPLLSGGSTTLKRELKLKGLEPDACFWIKNAARMRGKNQFRFPRDPAPDLAIEVEISRSALDRMGIYAALRIAEVWRFNGTKLHVHRLGADGRYKPKRRSGIFPRLPIDKLQRFLQRLPNEDENKLIREFTTWVRTEVVPVHSAENRPAPGK